MNHACEPTLLPEDVVQLRGYFRIVFIALRHIYPGEELTFDYSAAIMTSSSRCPLQRTCLLCSHALDTHISVRGVA
jgi:SET domain-containing protein